jgi:hypothetical protein
MDRGLWRGGLTLNGVALLEASHGCCVNEALSIPNICLSALHLGVLSVHDSFIVHEQEYEEQCEQQRGQQYLSEKNAHITL